jgi:hypothetical protein
MFVVHMTSVLHGVLVDACSVWPKTWFFHGLTCESTKDKYIVVP